MAENNAIRDYPWPKTPSLARADFAYLARIIAGLTQLDEDTLRSVAEHFAYYLADRTRGSTRSGSSTPP